MSINVAVVGATGNVGREMISLLQERAFSINELFPVASKRSSGQKITFGSKELTVQNIETFSFKDVDLALFSAGSEVSKIYAPKAEAAGCYVIDNSSYFRMHKDIPLIIPEVNIGDIAKYKSKIIANPNCSTIQMLVALKPLHDLAIIKRIVVSTYQSVSGAGKAGMDELYFQTKGLFENKPVKMEQFTKQISFNVIPHIDVFLADGSTKEEWKMIQETKKILDPNIEVSATCVRCPIFLGHAESVNVEFEEPISEKEAYKALANADGVLVVDRRADGGYITPKEVAKDDDVYVSRLRKDPSVKHGLNLWVVADNLRKGAALNAVQIAEHLFQKTLKNETKA
jgi:aspartate-semialdehyde dehydrogenase